jgi:hypothetical protein
MCTIRRIIRQQCIPTKLPVSPDAVAHHIIYYQQNRTVVRLALALFLSRCTRGMDTATNPATPEQARAAVAVGHVRPREEPALFVPASADDPDQRAFVLPQTRRKRGRRFRNTPAARNADKPDACDAVVPLAAVK